MPSQVADRERITALLHEWHAGDKAALDRLVPLLYGDLRRLAQRHLRGEAREGTLQPSALVNEVYLRLTRLHAIDWQNRAHFFAMASRLMRRVLVDAARARRAGKRGRSHVRVSFDEARIAAAPQAATSDVLLLDEALTALGQLDERKLRVVEMRFFGGLSVEETAAALGVSVETIARDWRFAKLWLRREITKAAGDD
jgi:RNA polymerase sigma factor (TIGR02999 family)